MVIVELKHIVESSEIDKYLVKHRQFLQKNYEKGLLLVSGPKIPRDGGICIAMTSLEGSRELMKEDSFWVHNLAEYRFVEFEAVKAHEKIKEFCVGAQST